MIATDLIAEIRRLDKRLEQARTRITARVEAAETSLLRIRGISYLNAAKILARTGPVTRFPSPSAFAAYAGVAPREVSSGDAVRHRLSRTGDRQLNTPFTSLRLYKPASILQARPTTSGNGQQEKPKKKPSVALNADSPTSSTGQWSRISNAGKRAWQDTRERQYNPAWPTPIPLSTLRKSHTPDPPKTILASTEIPPLDREAPLMS